VYFASNISKSRKVEYFNFIDVHLNPHKPINVNLFANKRATSCPAHAPASKPRFDPSPDRPACVPTPARPAIKPQRVFAAGLPFSLAGLGPLVYM
jgi:hypothetical protein